MASGDIFIAIGRKNRENVLYLKGAPNVYVLQFSQKQQKLQEKYMA